MNTQTITIPQNLVKNDDLIILPRREYEKLLFISKKKRYTQFDKNLDKIISETKEGKIIGPFDTADDLVMSLQSN